MSRIQVIVAFLIAGVISVGTIGGCTRRMPKPRFGKDFNDQRQQRAIPVIPESWSPYGVFDDLTQWGNPRQSSGQWDGRSAIRSIKYVRYDKNDILKETDTYYSGRTFDDPAEGEVDESMYIEYSYVAERQEKSPWQCRVSWGPLDGEHTLEEAQAILRKWGIPEEDIPGMKK